MGAPVGNDNAAKGRDVERMLKRCVLADDGVKLRKMCEGIYKKASELDPWACEFMTERLDGRPRATAEGDDPQRHEIVTKVIQTIVDGTGA